MCRLVLAHGNISTMATTFVDREERLSWHRGEHGAVTVESFTPVSALVGGALIGLGAAALYAATGTDRGGQRHRRRPVSDGGCRCVLARLLPHWARARGGSGG